MTVTINGLNKMSQSSLRIPIVLTTKLRCAKLRIVLSQSSLRIPIVLTRLHRRAAVSISLSQSSLRIPIVLTKYRAIANEEFSGSQSSLRIPIVLTYSKLLNPRAQGQVSILTEDSDRSNTRKWSWTSSGELRLNPH